MINDEIDSINFKNAIIKSQIPLKYKISKNEKTKTIPENYKNDYFGNFVIENYPNLEKLIVKKNSLRNLNSLKICNNEKLKTIEIENGDNFNGAFLM